MTFEKVKVITLSPFWTGGGGGGGKMPSPECFC